MSFDPETTRIVRSWLDEGVTQLPDRVLDAVLHQVPATPQRRATWWPARRTASMNVYAKVIAAATVVVVTIAAYQFLTRGAGFGGRTTTPLPSPVLLVRGNFMTSVGEVVALDATRGGFQRDGPHDGVGAWPERAICLQRRSPVRWDD